MLTSLCRDTLALVAADALTKDRLSTPDAVLTLGAVVVRVLQEKGIVTLFINREGIVELCPQNEMELDGLSEDAAIKALVDRGYHDDLVVEYLKGREARKR